ncbi:hypothetical protein PS15m_000015 [Mucor circinelloides]
MRFIELLVAITATAAVAVSAAPLGNKDMMVAPMDTNKMVFDPKTVKRQSGRRQQQINKYQKRHKPCCGATLGLGFDAQARLDVGSNAPAAAAVDPPVAANANTGAAAAVPAPGDTINVHVENNHVN